MRSNSYLQSPPSNLRAKRAGFTLVEMMISLMIFSIVAVVAIGALVKIVSANKKAQTLQSAITNLNFALEAMSREMRTGTSLHCETDLVGWNSNSSGGMAPNSCYLDQGQLIAFYSTKTAPEPSGGFCNLIYAYRFNDNGTGGSPWQLEKYRQTACNEPVTNNSPFTSIVSEQVTITDFRLGIEYSADKPYSRALIRLSGYAGVREKEKTYFDVQTAVSGRTP